MSEKNQSIRPTVVIDLPPLLEAYCRFFLDTPKDQDELVATRRNDIGKAINGFLTKTTLKPETMPTENPVVFVVPVTEGNHYSLFSNHLYISKEDQEQIVDRIEVMFNKWIDVFFQDGYRMNLSQLDIIESVLDILNVRMNATNFDQIKKRDYRKTKTEVRERSKMILKQRLSIA
jgi:hypothetical protein